MALCPQNRGFLGATRLGFFNAKVNHFLSSSPQETIDMVGLSEVKKIKLEAPFTVALCPQNLRFLGASCPGFFNVKVNRNVMTIFIDEVYAKWGIMIDPSCLAQVHRLGAGGSKIVAKFIYRFKCQLINSCSFILISLKH